METFVIKEVRRPYSWFYNDTTRRYTRYDDEGNVQAFVEGIHLPDPYILSANLERAALKGNNLTGRIRADPVTYSLWQHWTEVANGHANH